MQYQLARGAVAALSAVGLPATPDKLVSHVVVFGTHCRAIEPKHIKTSAIRKWECLSQRIVHGEVQLAFCALDHGL